MPTLDEVIEIISAGKLDIFTKADASIADVTPSEEIRRVASFVLAANDPSSDEVEQMLGTLVFNEDHRADVVTHLETLWPECPHQT